MIPSIFNYTVWYRTVESESESWSRKNFGPGVVKFGNPGVGVGVVKFRNPGVRVGVAKIILTQILNLTIYTFLIKFHIAMGKLIKENMF